MSFFQNSVIRAQRRITKLEDNSMPLIEALRYWERRFWTIAIVGLVVWVLGVWFIYWANGKITYELEMMDYVPSSNRPPPVHRLGTVFFPFQILWLVIVGYLAGMGLKATFDNALKERIALTKAKEEEKSLQQSQKAMVAREQEKLRMEAEKQAEYRGRQLFQLRQEKLLFLENGVIDILNDARRRMEWIPETADEEKIYELIRQRIKASGAPEFGLLRRTYNLRVLAVLGNDLSFLPPEPSDQMLEHRHFAPVVQLLR